MSPLPWRRLAAGRGSGTGMGSSPWLIGLIDRPGPGEPGALEDPDQPTGQRGGARLEADLWPHLRGITVAWLANLRSARPAGSGGRGAPDGRRSSGGTSCRECAAAPGRLWGRGRIDQTGNLPSPVPWGGDTAVTRPLGRPAAVRSRPPLEAAPCWSAGAIIHSRPCSEPPSIPTISHARDRAASGGPLRKAERFGAFWPGRMRLPSRDSTARRRWLVPRRGPSVVWTGWNRDGQARDRVAGSICMAWSGASWRRSPLIRRPPLNRVASSRRQPMRLIDLHCNWALQYAGETCQYDPAAYAEIRPRLGQVDGYLSGPASRRLPVAAAPMTGASMRSLADPGRNDWPVMKLSFQAACCWVRTTSSAGMPSRLLVSAGESWGSGVSMH